MNIHAKMEQGSDEWLNVRRGRPTASQFKRLFTPAKATMAAKRFEYMDELIAESFFPDSNEIKPTEWMQRGTELEPMARESFQSVSGMDVEEVGFCTRDDGVVGCSPDGLIRNGDDWWAGLEIKCPAPKAHVRYRRVSGLPDEHKVQVHGGMAVTGLNTWFFFSYCPGLQPCVVKVERDEFTDTLCEALDIFLAEYETLRGNLIPLLQVQ